MAEVFPPAGQSKRFAFTLAEVLITLGIIGVVAALTMPTLIQNYKKHEVETKLAKFYSVMNQAVRLAEVEYGNKMYWDTFEIKYGVDDEGNIDKTKIIPNFEYFNKYFAPYLKTTKITSSGTESDSIVLVYFADGSAATFDARAIHYYIKAKDLNLDGNIRHKLKGKRLFTFYFAPTKRDINHYNKGIEPYKDSWNGSLDSLITHPSLGCNEESFNKNEPAYCTALIQANGWKVPKNYPFKF